ncbi:YhgE/Pip domain-containing protein [Microbacterium sp. 4R-513]|uniref:YhgE/Pip domain-containing protein n=1 Tax=Microbacterium sp. 4R-513 TaxID=2567934 RepID=UPI0013E18583|nr:YhgE/Pip domain-containing protein [Microbacterium sp. 4R-513]QIG38924.1 YhgE/Pip domain-containing protein [Microbacterium sp. 4R-513]
MRIPAMIAAELRRLTATRMSVIALVALLLVPVLYGGLYLWANQDPYGRFAEIPVGLVNEDAGAAASGDEPAADYGERVADELLDGRAFDWRLLSAPGAQRALEEGDVDFVVVIPADFSEALASAAGTAPRQASIELETNDANNYLASTIGSQAVEKIRASVAQSVAKEAATSLLSGIADIRVKLVDAADGAAQLADGATDAADGADRLESGAGQLASGTATLADGAHKVAGGAQQVADGTATIAGYADRAGAAVQQATDALPTARADIAATLAEQGLDPAQIDAVLAKLDPVADDLRQGNQTVQTAVGRVDALADGASQVASGAAQVATGADSAAGGAAELSTGASALADGLGTLADGTAQLRDGLASGVAAIPDSSPELRAAQAQTISDPVSVSSGNLAAADDYGAGLAPFFAALAGWIGIYALFLIVKPISRRAVTALHSPLRITAAGWLTPALLGGLQMTALFGILAFALGFGFAHPLATLGVMVLASFTYAAVILALTVWFGSVGQFLGLVLMVVQLVTAGGTFPWQTLPAPLADLHHVLPMGFVVDAMRQFMYGGDLARVGSDVAALLTWMLGSLVVAALGVTRMTHFRTLRDLQPSLIG